jgi:methionyl-tRNA formyltransferase
MQMDAGLDTGDMLLVSSIPILSTDTTGVLHDRLAMLGGDLMVQALTQAAAGQLKPVQQPLEGITYASKVDKSEATIDWRQPAQTICQRIRAFNPFPGASTQLNGETLKIWAAQASASPAATSQPCGEIVALDQTGIAVAAMNSVVTITELQRPGGKRLGAADFLRGFPLQAGQVLA